MTRPMVTVGIPFLTACLAASYFAFDAVMCGFALLAALFLAVLFFRKQGQRLKLCAILGAAMAGLLCWAGWLTAHPFDFSSVAGQTHTLTGRVKTLEQRENGRLSCTLAVEQNGVPGAPERFTALLYLPGESGCAIGSRIETQAKALSFSQTSDFDMALYYRGAGIDASFSTYETPKLLSAGPLTLRERLTAWNGELCEKADAYLAAPYAGLTKAILLGNDADIPAASEDAFQLAGVTHLFVVSGLHVSLIGGLLLLLLKKLRMSGRWAAVAACAGVWVFVLLTGAKIPAVRSGVMATVLLAGTLFHRPADGLNSLFTAGVLLALGSPAAVTSGSFQLSFLATLGAVTLAAPLSGWIVSRLRLTGPVGRAVAGTLGMTFACNFCMLPALSAMFRGISLVSPLTNLVACTLLPLLLALSLLLLACPITEVCTLLGQALGGLYNLLLHWCGLLTISPLGYLGLNYRFVGVWCGLSAALLAGVLLLKQPKIFGRLAVFCLCGLAGLLVFSGLYNRGVVEVTPLYSFSGWGAVVRRGTTADVVLFTDDDYLGETVLNFLRSKNVNRIDSLILAAENTDHAADERRLAAAFPIGNLLLFPENELAPYAQTLLSPENGVYFLQDGHGFDLQPAERGGSDVTREGEGVRLLVTMGETRVCLAGSTQLAEHVNCEIYIYQGNISEILRKNQPEYVILIDEPEAGGDLPLGKPRGAPSVTLAKDGRFRLS